MQTTEVKPAVVVEAYPEMPEAAQILSCEAVLATVGRLKGKKVWASEELAKPPTAGFFRRLIHKGANS